ncbi:DUF2867 domain-containing protein [Undibacterium sp. CY18W]|uniref:DUF2867 domain-containing protein n=1 Tax=Undibacterium hunanense TaxID=2762292 RepID=A0ABR6ZYT6_9BURK|nr:DUF2867 domain-containing protein [Undibacterium hunanense]MBC3921046.1 DUF2867 domain-containing protein [Undibacterium hunanense]
MKSKITETAVPAHSKIAEDLPGAYFYDCYQMPFDHTELSAMQIYMDTFARTPAWVNALMGVRNRVVGLFGLKNLGGMKALNKNKPAEAYQVGDRAGIFSLVYKSDEEVIFCDSDKHLDVKVSVSKQIRDGQPGIAVTTIVHVHNNLGRAYMLFVGPAHKVIAPAVLSRA